MSTESCVHTILLRPIPRFKMGLPDAYLESLLIDLCLAREKAVVCKQFVRDGLEPARETVGNASALHPSKKSFDFVRVLHRFVELRDVQRQIA